METIAKTDRRIKRTQHLLGDALVSLILEKGYEAVTIREIAERADVAHVTFYRHYQDKDDLLNAILGDSLTGLVAQIEQSAQEAFHGSGEAREGTLIFQHVQAQADLYRILLGSQGALRVRRQVQETIAAIFLRACPPVRAGNTQIPGEILANHIAAALLALIEWWLAHDLPYPVERMAHMYEDLILASSLQILRNNEGPA